MLNSAIDLAAFDLRSMKTVELRKLAGQAGIKGQSSARKEHLLGLLEPLQLLQAEKAEEARKAEAEALEAEKAKREARIAEELPVSTPVRKSGTCEDCGRKVGKSGHKSLCEPCLDYAGWENTHSDSGHQDGEGVDADSCPVCHPELDRRTPKTSGRSRAGMVIVAKGTEFHKSATFKAAAEAAGWTVNVLGTVSDDEETERFVAVATKGDDRIELAWNGRAYDYPASSATFGGKSRKVRNLKEALRLL